MTTRILYWLLFLPGLAWADCALPEGPLRADTVLVPGCVYHQSVRVEKPLTLDCQGAVLDGDDRLAAGLVINSRGQPLSGVVIRNCTIRHFTQQGILIHWGLPNDQKVARYTVNERYQRTPQQILLQRVRVEHNGAAGIVLDDYVQSVVMDQISVQDNAGWGLYWDHASRGHVLKHSEIRRNGLLQHKQGLAIDASSQNQVLDNVFEGNARSAIQLYRNCWEFAATRPRSIPRETGANDNIIQGNQFIHEQVGVWIAARMSQDLSAMHCGRSPYDAGKYYEDEALRNQVIANRFFDMQAQGIVIEDDENQIIGNVFDRAAQAIVIGAARRARVLGKPVRGTVVDGNHTVDGQALLAQPEGN